MDKPETHEDEEDEEDLTPRLDSNDHTTRKVRGVRLEPKEPASTGKLWLTLSVPLVACEFAGNHTPWALALLAALVGLHLVLNPPRAHISRTITWPLCLIAILMLASLLPASASFLPEWRTRLRTDFGISLSTLLAPQPWVTLENWILFMIGLTWFLSCLGRRYGKQERRWLALRLTIGMALIAVQSFLFGLFEIHPAFWQHEWPTTYSGPFSNPDVFGCFLAMGLVLSIAVVHGASRKTRGRLLLHALCLVPMFWVLLVNSSRAGVLLFFGGMIVWVCFSSFSKRSTQRISLYVALLLTLAALYITFGDTLLDRLAVPKPSFAPLSIQARLKLATSTMEMISGVPLLGVGLGNFEEVFALTSPGSDFFSRPVHPGSDWLWLAAEAGLPVVILMLLAVIAYIFSTGSWRSKDSSGRKYPCLRSACAVAALMVPVHGIIDVPGHHVGLLFTMMLLAGLSLPSGRKNSSAPQATGLGLRLIPVTFCFGIAALWLAVNLGYPALPGSLSADMLGHRSARQDDEGDLEKARQSITSAIAMRPLHWRHYYDRASLSLAMGQAPNLVLEDFARARILEKHSGLLCYQEALLWMRYRPKYSIPAWRQALERDHARASQFFATLCGFLPNEPELRASVRDLATDPRLKLAYLDYATSEDFAPALQALLHLHPALNLFTPEELLKLFRLWYAHGDRSTLLNALDRNPTWRTAGWPILASDSAAAGDYKRACQLVMENVTPTIDGTTRRTGSLEQLRHAFLLHSTDYSYGLDLYEAEKAKNLMDDALRTLEKVSQIPGAPQRYLYDQAVLLIRKDDYAKAWDKLCAYLELRDRSERASLEPAGQRPVNIALPRSKHLQMFDL